MVGFYRIAKFPGVTGCIDCTHIRIKAPGGPDGEVYRNRNGYFSINVQWSDLTLTVYTDGSALLKSTNASIWPIHLPINELPQPHRNANTFLAGLWFGRKHPIMALFMEKFGKAVQEIGEILWQHGVIDLVSKVYLAYVCVDAPARATVGNQTQFNGLFSCLWCLTCGTLED
ncbi:hypothetical protein MTO96_038341, partial [Rhipicephalus appendiculatus]